MINKTNNQKDCPPVFRKSELRRGFTLIETLMAVTIITISITGPLAMASQASRLISVAKNQLIAAYLGQEAMEFVRQKRDYNIIQKNDNPGSDIDWITGLPEGDSSGLGGCVLETANPEDFETHGCYVDLDSGIIEYCSNPISDCVDNDGNPAARMYFKKDIGYLYRNIGVAIPSDGECSPANVTSDDCYLSSFKRFFLIEKINMDDGSGGDIADGAKVRVKIMWTDSFGEKTIYMQSNLYNYR